VKNIELVKKWLDDSESVTQEELNDNYANAAAYSAAPNADYVVYAAYAAYANVAKGDFGAAYWVKKYEELTK
jgi:hypothetical protein